MKNQKEEKWFTDIVEELRRTGCGPDCEGPTRAKERADKASGQDMQPKE